MTNTAVIMKKESDIPSSITTRIHARARLMVVAFQEKAFALVIQ
jgi:hypothetical protein